MCGSVQTAAVQSSSQRSIRRADIDLAYITVRWEQIVFGALRFYADQNSPLNQCVAILYIEMSRENRVSLPTPLARKSGNQREPD